MTNPTNPEPNDVLNPGDKVPPEQDQTSEDDSKQLAVDAPDINWRSN